MKTRPYRVSTHRAVADFFGVSVATIGKWRAEDMPGTARAYDLDTIAQWRLRRQPVEKEESSDAKWKRHRAELVELRLQRERGVLIELEEYERMAILLSSIFRNGLLSMIPTIAMQIGDLDHQGRLALLRDRCAEILENVSVNIRGQIAPKKRKTRPTRSKSRRR